MWFEYLNSCLMWDTFCFALCIEQQQIYNSTSYLKNCMHKTCIRIAFREAVMCVCVCVCACVHLCVCVHVLHACLLAWLDVCMHVCVHAFVFACVHECMLVTCVYVGMCVCVCLLPNMHRVLSFKSYRQGFYITGRPVKRHWFGMGSDSVRRRFIGITMLTLNSQLIMELKARVPDFPDIMGGVLVHKIVVGSPAFK